MFGNVREMVENLRKIVTFHIIKRKLHGCLEIRNISSRVEKYFPRSLHSIVEYFSTLEDKFRISARPCNIYPLFTLTKYQNLNLFRLPVSHCVPLKPGAQLQLNPFTRSVQVPSFLQGLIAHSSISVSNEKMNWRIIQ